MTTRKGKIGRLPRVVRDELNERIENGEPGTHLVAWLNSLPQVQAVMAAQFGRCEISEPYGMEETGGAKNERANPKVEGASRGIAVNYA